MVLTLSPKHCRSFLLPPFPPPLIYAPVNSNAITSSHPDWHCLCSLNLLHHWGKLQYTTISPFKTWLVIVTTKIIHFLNGKSWAMVPDAIKGGQKLGLGYGTASQAHHTKYLYSDAMETFICTFPEAVISTHLLRNQTTPGHCQTDHHRTWTPSVLLTQPEDTKHIWSPQHFRTAPILSTWTVSCWPNSHGSVPWWTKEANLRHPTSKMPCFCLGVHVLAQESTLQTLMLPVPIARSGLPFPAKFRWTTLNCWQMMHMHFPTQISI